MLTLRFDLRGSSLISTHLFKVLNRLKEDTEINVVVRPAASYSNSDLLHTFFTYSKYTAKTANLCHALIVCHHNRVL